jgi:hypothetical protein
VPIDCKSPLVNKPSDLRVELRSTSGSNRFKVGEPIELEAVFSSKAPGTYLEPWGLFGKPNIKPGLGFHFAGPSRGGLSPSSGPTFEVPNHDLSSNPASHSYRLSNAYRFDEPGEYHVTLTVTVGLDDESKRHPPGADPGANPHFVMLTLEIVLRIVAKSC